MNIPVKLTVECPVVEIPVSTEIGSLHINNLKLINCPPQQTGYSIEYSIFEGVTSPTTTTIHTDSYKSKGSFVETEWNYSGLLKGRQGVKKIVFEAISLKDDAEIHFELQTRNLVSISVPLKRFHEHIIKPNNCKILLSAPFGQGKTTFLQLFFKEKSAEYNTFHLFPVNYSVVRNEDIFELIKCEILLKLLENTDVNFNKETFDYLETIPYYLKRNADKIIAPFLTLLPLIGRDLLTINDRLNLLMNTYFAEHDSLQIDDAKKAKDYIKSFIDKEGSLYESNFYTELIRNLLGALKESSNKENVLIIDDFDRLDPDHVFRILNVFAAHFDGPENNAMSNKFGFDKIIIVCDYNNLEKIYKHKFGAGTDYSGYMNKFFSHHIFYYDNLETAKSIIKLIAGEEHNYYGFRPYAFRTILEDMFITQNITLRELLKLLNVKFDDEIKDGIDVTDQFLITIFRHLAKIFDTETLIEKLKRTSADFDKHAIQRADNYDSDAKQALIQLHFDFEKHKDRKIQLYHNSILYSLNCMNVSSGRSDLFRVENIVTSANNGGVLFTHRDFYTILTEILSTHRNKIVSQKPVHFRS